MNIQTAWGNPIHRKAITALVAAAAAISLSLMGWGLMGTAYPDPSLPEPGPHPSLPDRNIRTFMDAAARNQGTPHMTRAARVPHHEKQRFTQQFRNIAANRGWYAFPDAGAITLIIPAEELHDLEPALETPIAWAQDELTQPAFRPPPPPDANDLVKVRITQAPMTRGKLAVFLLSALASWIAALVMAILSGCAANELIQHRRQLWRDPKGQTP